MKRTTIRLLLFFFVLASLCTIPLYSQQKPRIAVLPFSAVEVSESEARGHDQPF